MNIFFKRMNLHAIFAVMILTGATTVVQAAPQPIAHYTFNGGKGNVADVSGNKLGGTPYGGQYVKSGDGYVMSLDGKGFVKCASRHKPAFGTGNFTVQALIKLDGYRSGGMIGKQGQKRKSRGWGLAYNGTNHTVTFYVANGQQRKGISAPLKDLQWHQLTAVRHGHTLAIYIDGKQVAHKSNPFFATNVNSGTYLFLGRIIGHPASFDGKLDEVKIYSGAMSASMIARQFAKNQTRLDAHRAATKAKHKNTGQSESALILHYTFNHAPDHGTVKDLSTFKNNGKVTDAKYIQDVNGRSGVLRFNGISSMLKVAASPSLNFGGDMTLEMWVRLNSPVTDNFAWLMGEIPPRDYFFGISGYLTFLFRYSHYNNVLRASEDTPVPVSASDYFGDKWEHIAIVVQYPRCLFYKNGKLVRNAYMPLEGIQAGSANPIYIGGSPRGYMPVDLDEVRLYRRALTAKEIAADARGKRAVNAKMASRKLTAVKHWYKNKLILRLTTEGIDQTGHHAKLMLYKEGQSKPVISKSAAFELAFANIPKMKSRGRYQAKATVSLPPLAGQSYRVVAQILDSHGQIFKKIERKISLKKPAWVDNKLGDYNGVLPPWTPVQTKRSASGGVKVGVWGRWYIFGNQPFPQQITSKGDNLLTSPITLTGKTNSGAISWQRGKVELKKASDTQAKLQQNYTSNGLSLKIDTKIAYDGYMIFDCALTAKRNLTLNQLLLTIPLQSSFAKLCYGNRVQPKRKDKNGGRMPFSPWYSGAVKGDLSFKFSPSIWLGNPKGGLTWQASSDQYWHYAKKYQAIEILPRGSTTRFVAHFVDVPSKLQAGQTLHYKFALLATPVKPMGKTYWDLRIMRAGPFGNVFHYPDKTIHGKPELKILSDIGVRHLYYYIGDIWPWPMPVHKKFKVALHRLVHAAHNVGIKVIPYVIHERFPVMVPEFDTHGLLMATRPMKAYVPRGVESYPNPRPGPIGGEYGAEAQGDVFFCPKSKALQDAYIYSLSQRLKKFGEDGVYLDGTAQIVPDRNLLHGCGYIAKDGTVHKTYPVFAVRKFMKRIYTVTKMDNPNNIVFVHGSWGNNPAGQAYADIRLTGEQWWYLHGKGASYIPAVFPLAQARTGFLGRQFGVPVVALSYRLGSAMRMAAETLLGDVPIELNQGGRSTKVLLGLSGGVKKNAPSGSPVPDVVQYTKRLIRLWHVRKRFGAKQAKKFFYWQKEQSKYATISPDKCYLLIFKHPKNGALVFVTNLSRHKHNVTVDFNLDALGLANTNVKAVDIFTRKPVKMSNGGQVSIPLGSQQWTYLWLKP